MASPSAARRAGSIVSFYVRRTPLTEDTLSVIHTVAQEVRHASAQPDALEDYVRRILAPGGPAYGYVPLLSAVTKIEDVTAVLWHRRGQFQSQLFIVPPNYIIPEHTHPNVDSFECYVGGQIRFSLNGKYLSDGSFMTVPDVYGLPAERGMLVRVKPADVHGGTFGAAGGVFLSIQHWLNGVEPHCVAADYDGIVMGADHLSKVKSGTPILKNKLTASDAASNEIKEVQHHVR